jgi:hypothetical protein
MGFDCHATALAAAKATPKVAAALAAAASGGDSAKAETTLANLDGINLLPHLLGETTAPPHDYLCWRAGAQRAIRMGDWKLIQTPRDATAQLFNLKDDIGEQHDLAQTQPEKLKELQAAFADWEKGTQPAKWVRQDQRNAEEGGKAKPGASQTPTRRGAQAAGRIDDSFKAADKNGDGKLTREEYPRPEVFDAVDADKDGHATLEEVRAYYQKRRAQSPANPRP